MADMKASIKLDVAVENAQSMTALADQLHDVSKVLDGEMRQAAQAAAQQLRELAAQDAAITAFRDLQADTARSAQALKAAERELANYSAQVGKGALATREQADALVRLQAAAKAAGEAHKGNNAALTEAADALTRMGISTKDTAAAQERLRAQVLQVRGAVQQLLPAYQGVAQGAGQAGAQMERTHRQIGEGVDSISKQLQALQAVFLAVAGAQQFAGMAKDLAQTADQVNNLRARMELVTGAGQAFGAAWEGVQQIALATHSALEETGTLFARLAQAGRDAGLSTAKATEQSLRLTETINQAVQLSGASAQASSAAITQLIQGLQSGVLRGDEFNSVMEQAPRLAKALADGLGVTTGELRKMAEAGALTAQTVIGALQGQSAKLQQEFAQLPPTVGRALQDLSTQWTLYVGELDKSSGASSTAAQAINLLSGNLRQLGGLLMDAGQALAAFVALGVAQHFYGLATASSRAAAELAAMGTVSKATAVQVEAASVAAGRFAMVLSGLKMFSLLGIVTNFKDIGTWIGEAAAKLMGYKDRSEELARQEKLNAEIAKQAAADRARLAAATQAAIDRQFDLSKAAAAAVAEFGELTKKGMGAAEALKKVTEGFDLGKVQGLKDFQTTLNKLAADGKLTAGEVQDAWNNALKGVDLGRFEVTARQAFFQAQTDAEKAAKAVQEALAKGVDGKPLEALQNKARELAVEVERAGERMRQALDAGAREAVARTGIEWEVLQGKIGAAARSAINDVDAMAAGLQKLKAEGIDTGRALTASLMKAIDTADSQAAIDSITAKIKQLRGELGDKLTDGLLDQAAKKSRELADALDAATPGINSVREAFKQLGVTSDEELKRTAKSAKDAFDVVQGSGKASTRELQQAWKVMAEAAIAANNGVADAAVKAQASQYGFVLESDKAGKTIVKSMQEAQDATKGVGSAAQGAAKSMQELAQDGWQAGQDMVDQARAHNAALNKVETSWMQAGAAASKYSQEMAQVVWRAGASTQQLGEEHARLVQLMEDLAAQQRQVQDAGGGAARGVDDLRLRLLELDGTEQQVAAARHARDLAEVQAKQALAQIDLERARLKNDDAEVARMEREVALLGEQLQLLDQIYARETQQRQDKARQQQQEQRQRAVQEAQRQAAAAPAPSPQPQPQPQRTGGGSYAGLVGAPATVNITLNANGINDPVMLARQIEPELARLGRLAR